VLFEKKIREKIFFLKKLETDEQNCHISAHRMHMLTKSRKNPDAYLAKLLKLLIFCEFQWSRTLNKVSL